ncbi:MAG: CHAT domain-containing protein [SAR324 cluster bacterium]|nr:CHAT domain-containing protein [SAR324 cluster bacterium]MBL7034099.1 CHAT domain-containing protein [SAR324 cluster bacterium]
MQVNISFFRSEISGLFLILLLILFLDNPAYSQTSTEEATALWSVRQTEIEQQYQEGNLKGALEKAQEAVLLAKTAFGAAALETISSLMLQSQLHTELDQLEEANLLYQTTLETVVSTLGENDVTTLAVLDNYGAFLNSIDPEMAEPVLQEALRLSAEDDPQRAARLKTLGLNLRDLGRIDEAVVLLSEALETFKTILGNKDIDTLSVTAQLAKLYVSQGKLKPAQDLLETALPLMLEVLDKTSLLVLEGKENLAEIYRQQGRYSLSENLFLESIKGAVAEYGKEDPLVVQAKSHLAQLYEDTGKLKQALDFHQQVYDIDLLLLGEAHPNTAGDLNNLASVRRRMGNYQKAEKLFRQSLKVMIAALGEESPQTVSVMNNLALLLENQGLYDEAEPLFKKAFAISGKIQGEKHPTSLALLNNLAFLNESQGDFTRSEVNYKKVIQLNTEVFGANHTNTIANQNNLAYLFLRDGRYEEARPIFSNVFAQWSKQLGANHQNTLKALNNLGRVYKSLGNLAVAEEHLSAALAGRTQVFGKRHADTLRSMNDMGELLVVQDKKAEALKLFQETLKLEEEVLGKNHPYTFETLNNLADLLKTLGRTEEAYKVFKTGFVRRNAFLDRVLWVAGDNTRQSYISLYRPEQHALIRMLLSMNDERTARDLFEVSLRRKGILLKITSETQQVVMLSGAPELQAITEELTQTRKTLAGLTLSGPTEGNRKDFPKIVYDLEEKVNMLQLKLGEQSQRFRQSTKQVTVDEVIEGLGENALVDFMSFRGEDNLFRLVAVVVKGGEFSFVEFEDLELISSMVMELREIVQDEGAEDEDVKSVALELWEVLWQPLTAALGETASIFISPDGLLNVLPFDVLTDEDDSYLLENFDLRIISSARDLALDPLPEAKGELLIIAGPDYDSDKILKTPAAREVTHKRSRSVSQGARMGSGLRGLNFDPLPGAEKEGEVIKDVADTKDKSTGGSRSSSIYSQRIAEENLLRKMSAPPEVLHIATHGFFLKEDEKLKKRLQGLSRGSSSVPPPADNPLLRAGLAFAGLNANASMLGEIDTDNDGVLTAMEVLSLNLSGTQLVVLSACETGLGEIHQGEGVYGLRRSFQEAGVKNVINSFWEVSDAGTQLLMTKFYDKFLAGMSARQAMREARLEMLDDVQWSAPYYWSAFVMVGRNS